MQSHDVKVIRPDQMDAQMMTQNQREDLRQRLAAVEAERDALEGAHRHHVAVALSAIERLNRAKAILTKLREPSEAVLLAAARFDTLEGLRAAVAAAEQEVGGER